MADIYLYTQPYINRLIGDIEDGSGLERYISDNPEFSHNRVSKLIDASIDEHLCDKMIAAYKKEQELDSAIILYEGLKGITPQMASNRGLWIYLAHNDLFKYVRLRWPITDYKKQSTYILDHWFFNRSSMMRHALSNLWWSVHMTYDENSKDPYWLTKVLFSLTNELRTRFFGSAIFLRNREAAIGILQEMSTSDTYKESRNARSLFVYRYFNSLGGYLQLSMLPREFFVDKMKFIENAVLQITDRSQVYKNKHLFDNLENQDDSNVQAELPTEMDGIWAAYKNREHQKQFQKHLEQSIAPDIAKIIATRLSGKVAAMADSSLDKDFAAISSTEEFKDKIIYIFQKQGDPENKAEVFCSYLYYLQVYHLRYGSLQIERTKAPKTVKMFILKRNGEETVLGWKEAIITAFEILGQDYLNTRIRLASNFISLLRNSTAGKTMVELPFGWYLNVNISDTTIIKECNTLFGDNIKISKKK